MVYVITAEYSNSERDTSRVVGYEYSLATAEERAFRLAVASRVAFSGPITVSVRRNLEILAQYSVGARWRQA